MMIVFAQNMGRLQRTINDSGTIFLLDERFYKKGINIHLRSITSAYGIIQHNTIDISNEFNKHWGINKSTIKVDLNEVGDLSPTKQSKSTQSLRVDDVNLSDFF